MKSNIPTLFAPESSIPLEIKPIENFSPNSANWENSFLAELARENCCELSEIDCVPIS
jgi:hypothetical protein